MELRQVEVSPSNQKYRFYGDAMIIGKQSNESNTYENLVSCFQSIKKITIPNFIRCINSFVFAESTIVNITIPNSVIVIRKSAFSYCKQLQHIEISKESKLQIIEESSFS